LPVVLWCNGATISRLESFSKWYASIDIAHIKCVISAKYLHDGLHVRAHSLIGFRHIVYNVNAVGKAGANALVKHFAVPCVEIGRRIGKIQRVAGGAAAGGILHPEIKRPVKIIIVFEIILRTGSRC
jgi:hypothetical protein